MKRTQTFTFRVSKETKEAMGVEAAHFGTTPGQLTALLVEKFVEARKENGIRLAYPPRYECWTPEEMSAAEAAFTSIINQVPGLLDLTKEIIESVEDPQKRKEMSEKLHAQLSNNLATDVEKT